MNVPESDWIVIRAMMLGFADTLKPEEGVSSSTNMMTPEKIVSFVSEVDKELNYRG
jgi:hypothetical protein